MQKSIINVEKSHIICDFSAFIVFLLRTNLTTRCTQVHLRASQSYSFGSVCVFRINFTYPQMEGCLKALFLNSPCYKKLHLNRKNKIILTEHICKFHSVGIVKCAYNYIDIIKIICLIHYLDIIYSKIVFIGNFIN